MGFQIGEMSTHVDRARVYAFRYAVYVEELGRPEPYADHRRRLVEDPFDETGYVFAAVDDAGAVVGTLRVNLSRNTPLGPYEDWYGMRAFVPAHPDRTAIVTKLMVSRALRRSRLAVDLASAAFAFGVREGVSHCFIDCNTHLKAFFEGLGFRQVAPDFRHPTYGLVHPMVLLLHDEIHLAAVASPLAPLTHLTTEAR